MHVKRVLAMVGVCLAQAVLIAAASGNNVDAAYDEFEAGRLNREQMLSTLRTAGPKGLQVLLQRCSELEKKRDELIKQGSPIDDVSRRLDALDRDLDHVGAARQTRASKLFWYTNLEEAKAAAEASGKPILHLRLLGNLTDELSCANSRFFRMLLYSNPEIADYLRENFVLSWKSVRPAPRITIDFGDGRVLERTITGNSIHYVLLSDGTVIDALPGLYGPQAFRTQLEAATRLANELRFAPQAVRSELLARRQVEALLVAAQRWHADLDAIESPLSRQSVSPYVTQRTAMLNVTPELTVDDWLGQAGGIRPATIALRQHLSWLDDSMTDDLWRRIADLHSQQAKIDDATRERMRNERPTAGQAGRLAMTKRVVEDPMLRLVRNLQGSVAQDMVRNEYGLRTQIHAWLVLMSPPERQLEQFNQHVYGELFKMPFEDPWLGLAPPDVYTGLTAAGIVVRQSSAAAATSSSSTSQANR